VLPLEYDLDHHELNRSGLGSQFGSAGNSAALAGARGQWK
jgi:hypothetical protein